MPRWPRASGSNLDFRDGCQRLATNESGKDDALERRARERNNKMPRALTLLLALAALSCSSKVDLNQPLVESSPNPTVVGTVREGVGHIAVDTDRLYWTALPTRNGGVGGTWSLRSCLKENCAATVITYDTQSSAQDILFGVAGASIYWFRDIDQKALYAAGNMTLMTSPIAGGAAQVMATVDAVELAVFDADRVYVSTSNGVQAISLTGAGAPVQLIGPPLETSHVLALAAGGDYLYWLSGGTVDTPAAAASLYRLRNDGTSTPEMLASDLEINADYGYTLPGLAVDSTSVYWTQSVLAGSVDRCPLAGCVGAPEVVVGPIRSPEALLIDGSTLYLRYEADAYQYVLASCTIGQCTSPQPIAQGSDTACKAETETTCGPTESMAVDDQYLYAVTTDQDLHSDSAQQNPVAQIRRFPK